MFCQNTVRHSSKGLSQMKHVGVYYRVSTDRQDLASQKSAVKSWLEGLAEDKRPLSLTEFKDHGQSGKNSQRKEYQALLKAAFEHKIDTIIVYRLDRLSRNATEAIQILLTLDQAGVGFISVTQAVLNLGLDNPFRRTMLAAFSEIADRMTMPVTTVKHVAKTHLKNAE
ncbi:MAG: recombinase family protein [Proteobacteria bacterium]|nr:MAG: recombinase family protein [Pseudomonadota bacterium]